LLAVLQRGQGEPSKGLGDPDVVGCQIESQRSPTETVDDVKEYYRPIEVAKML
jgi:hypothetical protein